MREAGARIDEDMTLQGKASRVAVRSLTVAVVVAAMLTPAAPVSAADASGLELYRWLDVEGRPLPFQDHAAILEALRDGEVVRREAIGRGVAGAQKLVLEHRGARFHAVFRSVDVEIRDTTLAGARRPVTYRDAAIFEAAAYELSELLGIGRVPPAAVRSLDGMDGTVQIWMEGTRAEVDLVEQDALQPPDPLRFLQQKRIMDVFDSLIANTDRNQGNLLIDEHWNVWLIDHTRGFKQSSELLNPQRLGSCERGLWRALQALDDETVQRRLLPYLERREISKLLLRWRKLVRHFESQIEKEGEAAVLFDLRPPAGTL